MPPITRRPPQRFTLYEWWVTPHRIDGLPFHDFMMESNANRGTVFGSDVKQKAETRFDLSNLADPALWRYRHCQLYLARQHGAA